MRLSEYYGREMPNMPTPEQLGITVPEDARNPLLFTALWLVIIDEANEDNGEVVVRVSQRTLADAAMCSRPTVKKALDFWLKSGAIVTHRVGYRVAVSRQLSGSYVAVSRQLTTVPCKSDVGPDAPAPYIERAGVSARHHPENSTKRSREYSQSPSDKGQVDKTDIVYDAPEGHHPSQNGVPETPPSTPLSQDSLRRENGDRPKTLPQTIREVDAWWDSAGDLRRAKFLALAAEGHAILRELDSGKEGRVDRVKVWRLGDYQKGVAGIAAGIDDFKRALDRADEIRAWRKKREEEANRPPETPKPTLPDFPLDPPAPSDRDLEEIPVDDWLVGLGPEWEAPYRLVEKAFAGNTMTGALTGWQKKLDAEFAAARANGGVQAHARDIRHIRHRFLDRIRDLRGGLDGN